MTAAPHTQATIQAFIDRWKPSGGAERANYQLFPGDTEAEQQLLQRLVDLNHQRAAEEAAGQVRWLRPDYQAPEESQQPHDLGLDVKPTQLTTQPAPDLKLTWPDRLPERIQAVRQALTAQPGPITPKVLTRVFGRATKNRITDVTEILDTLVMMGQAKAEEGYYVGK